MGQKSERKLFQRFERKHLGQIGLLTGVGVLLPAAGPANADVITQTRTFSFGCGPIVATSPGNATAPSTVDCSRSNAVTFSQFSSAGTLTEVDINLFANLVGSLGLAESASASNGATGTWRGGFGAALPGFTFFNTADTFSFNCTPVLCNTTSFHTFTESGGEILTGPAIAPYIGAGEVIANLAALLQVSTSNLGAGTSQARGTVLADPDAPEGLTVTYVFTPNTTVPEPDTLALLGLGALAGMGFARKRTKPDS